MSAMGPGLLLDGGVSGWEEELDLLQGKATTNESTGSSAFISHLL